MRQTNRQAVSCLVFSATVLVISAGCGSAGDAPAPTAPDPPSADAGTDEATLPPPPPVADAAPSETDATDPVDTGPPSPPPPRICTGTAKTHVVKVLADSYDPEVLAVCVGDSVKWVWTEGVHSVTSGDWCNDFGIFDSGERSPPATWTRKFPFKGFYPYYSTAEPTFDACTKMEGYITVTDR